MLLGCSGYYLATLGGVVYRWRVISSDNLESSFHSKQGLLVGEDALGVVVGCNHYAFRSNLCGAALDLAWERVMVSPDFKVIT